MSDRIITHHISAHHAVQGTEAEVQRILGRVMPPIRLFCMFCTARVGTAHFYFCGLDGVVTAEVAERMA